MHKEKSVAETLHLPGATVEHPAHNDDREEDAIANGRQTWSNREVESQNHEQHPPDYNSLETGINAKSSAILQGKISHEG